MAMFQARQGDIYIREVAEIPKGKETHERIIAYGEVTGHYHKIEGDFDNGVCVMDDEGSEDVYIQTKEDTQLVHNGHHDTIDLPKGKNIKFYRQKEYDYLAAEEERIRKVQD